MITVSTRDRKSERSCTITKTYLNGPRTYRKSLTKQGRLPVISVSQSLQNRPGLSSQLIRYNTSIDGTVAQLVRCSLSIDDAVVAVRYSRR